MCSPAAWYAVDKHFGRLLLVGVDVHVLYMLVIFGPAFFAALMQSWKDMKSLIGQKSKAASRQNRERPPMKQEINITQPEYLIEDWPGKYEVFSWLEYIVTVPNPIFFITTRKPNGAPNANLSSWGFLIGEKGSYSSLLAILNNSHTYSNILREGEWCVCFPSFQHYRQCFETIRLNAQDNDEITESGFTVELARCVQAPRIAECSINLECSLEWHRPLYENSRWHLLAGRVLHLAMDQSVMVPDPVERMRIMELMYNVRSTVHPMTGEQYGPNTLGLLNRVEDVFGKPDHSKDGV